MISSCFRSVLFVFIFNFCVAQLNGNKRNDAIKLISYIQNRDIVNVSSFLEGFDSKEYRNKILFLRVKTCDVGDKTILKLSKVYSKERIEFLTAIEQAIINWDSDVFGYLLSRVDFDFNVRSNNRTISAKCMILFFAVRENNVAALEFLSNEIPTLSYEFGQSLMYESIYAGSPDALAWLLAQGVNNGHLRPLKSKYNVDFDVEPIHVVITSLDSTSRFSHKHYKMILWLYKFDCFDINAPISSCGNKKLVDVLSDLKAIMIIKGSCDRKLKRDIRILRGKLKHFN